MKIWREYYLQANKCPSLPETHGTGFPSQPLKVIDLTDALILHFQPSELWGNINFCCSSHLICDALFLHLQGMNTAVCVCLCVCVCVHAHTQSLLTLWLFAVPWTMTHQAFLSMRFSWQELLEWVAISYSRGASWSSDQTRVFCIAGRFFTNWATRKYSFTVDYGCKGLKLKAEKTVLRKTHS